MRASQHPDPSDSQGTHVVLPEIGFVRQKHLLVLVPFSRSTLWLWVGSGAFPAPIKLSEGVTVWRVEDVRRWMAERQ